MSGYLAPVGFGDPRVAAIPQPWESQPYSPYEFRPGFDEPISIDPGIYALPQPGWHGDPGIVIPQDDPWAGDPGIVWQPPPSESGQRPDVDVLPVAGTDAVAQLSVGDHVEHGAKSMVIPGLFGGAITGIIAASGAPAGLKSATFVARGVGSTMAGIGAGAVMGLAVGASSPGDGDSLQTRYAVAGGLVGAASGAVFGSPATRGTQMAINAVANGALGWFIGRGLERRVDAELAAAAAQTTPAPVPTPMSTPAFGTEYA